MTTPSRSGATSKSWLGLVNRRALGAWGVGGGSAPPIQVRSDIEEWVGIEKPTGGGWVRGRGKNRLSHWIGNRHVFAPVGAREGREPIQTDPPKSKKTESRP